MDYKPRKKAICITDDEDEKFFADLEAYKDTSSDEDSGDEKLSPEDRLMYANMAAATDKYQYAIALQPANAPTKHAWKGKSMLILPSP